MAKPFQANETGTPGNDARSDLIYERLVRRSGRLNARARLMRRDLRADAARRDPKARPAPVLVTVSQLFPVRASNLNQPVRQLSV